MVAPQLASDPDALVGRIMLGDDGHEWSAGALASLGAALAALADGDARVVLLRAEPGVLGRGWESGPLAEAEERLAERLSMLVREVAECPLPVVALLDGDVKDAGLEVALACDVRLASASSRFGAPSVRAGTPPLAGGISRLARAAGHGTALRLLLTGDLLSADEALVCGLVSGVYTADALTAEGERLTGVIASRGPIAVRFTKEALVRGTEMPLEQALRYETDLTIILQATADRAEGVRAFTEKREPRFHGT